MEERSSRFIPKTKVGEWCAPRGRLLRNGFFIGSSFAGSLYESVQSGRTLLADISARPFLALTMLAGMAAGVFGFITGLNAIFKQKEKAYLVYLSTMLGGLLTLFLIAEMAFPH